LNGFDQWFRSVVVDVEQDVDCYGSGEEGGDDRDENVRALVAHVEVVVVVVWWWLRVFEPKSAEKCVMLRVKDLDRRSHCRAP
jgi:hypothetical protein